MSSAAIYYADVEAHNQFLGELSAEDADYLEFKRLKKERAQKWQKQINGM